MIRIIEVSQKQRHDNFNLHTRAVHLTASSSVNSALILEHLHIIKNRYGDDTYKFIQYRFIYYLASPTRDCQVECNMKATALIRFMPPIAKGRRS